MNQTDISFSEIYRKMDGILKERYGSSDGISEYLDRMDSVDDEGKKAVSSWNDDRFAMRNFRFLHSRIAQEYGRAFCSESDLHAILKFYGRLLEANDPVSLLEKAKGEEAARPQTVTEDENEPPKKGDVPTRRSRGSYVWLSVMAILVAAILVIVWLLIR